MDRVRHRLITSWLKTRQKNSNGLQSYIWRSSGVLVEDLWMKVERKKMEKERKGEIKVWEL